MNRTFVGYLKQSALLVLGEVPSEGDLDFNSIDHPDLGIALSTIFSVDSRVGQADLYSLKRPLFPLSIHSNSRLGSSPGNTCPMGWDFLNCLFPPCWGGLSPQAPFHGGNRHGLSGYFVDLGHAM